MAQKTIPISGKFNFPDIILHQKKPIRILDERGDMILTGHAGKFSDIVITENRKKSGTYTILD
jgi:hypothetical protein